MSADAESNKPSTATAAARATCSTPPAVPCAPVSACSPTNNKNPGELSTDQKATLAGVQHDNKLFYRAYLLKGQPCYVFVAGTLSQAKILLGGWLAW